MTAVEAVVPKRRAHGHVRQNVQKEPVGANEADAATKVGIRAAPQGDESPPVATLGAPRGPGRPQATGERRENRRAHESQKGFLLGQGEGPASWPCGRHARKAADK